MITIDKDCTINTDTHSYSVQREPPLIIATEKASGIEEHFAGDQAEVLWTKIRDILTATHEQIGEDEKTFGQEASDAITAAKDAVLGVLDRLTSKHDAEKDTAGMEESPGPDGAG